MNKCDKCLSIGDMGRCQNFKSPFYGLLVRGHEEGCECFERDFEK